MNYSNGSGMELTEAIAVAFKEAAAEGALCELRLRLLAGKIPELAPKAAKVHANVLEKALTERLGACLRPGETDTLERSRQLRNKLLHCDFHNARERAQQLGAPVRGGGVRAVELPTGNGSVSILETILRAAEGNEGRLVAEATSTEEIGVFGWFLEISAAGYLEDSKRIFIETQAILDRMVHYADRMLLDVREAAAKPDDAGEE